MMEEQSISKGEQERLARLASSKGRKVKKLVIWVVVLGLIVAGVYALIIWNSKQKENKPGMAIAELGRNHITPGTEHEPYNSNPPTSGPHFPNPANWGFYDTPLPDEQIVHNLEHGGIWISFRDANDQTLKGELKTFAEKYSLKVIITPRSENDSSVAVAAWGRLLKLDNFDRKQIEDFIGAFINQGPEKVPY